ncbi:helix-turn-helix transcriptional regulator [Nonomuraea turkmeniaca]|uniref:Helix-turn-helix transcriptional regulator n=1 Tax=Nonomuraea turkmeniaca TaxID=103838 RepID=A0A5S4EXJ7_9ACTN|nr:TetR family transcriptional regulator [Nonomuraea turkmeniaca]TMR08335.1 helix-turn-helix transcriptional regulator [Nonomuraea turkmeniaca]
MFGNHGNDRVDRRGRRSRRAIGEALIELILERGYEAVTVTAIISAHGVSAALTTGSPSPPAWSF